MHKYAVSFGVDDILAPNWAPAAAQARLNALEVSLSYADAETSAKYDSIISIVKGLQDKGQASVPSVHIPFGPWEVCTLSVPDEAQRQSGVSVVLDFLEKFKCLGAGNYTIHGSIEPITDEMRPVCLANLKKSLAELLPHFEKLGASLNVELLPRTCLGRTAEELLDIVSDFPKESLGVCLDVNHLCNNAKGVPAAIHLLADRIRTFHISDYDGVDECHWYPGLGVIDWEAVMKEIRAIRQDVLLIFECSGFLQINSWQKRDRDYVNLFRNSCNQACFLDNISQIIKMQNDYQLP